MLSGVMGMNLVFSFDENYVETFKVLMYSIYLNHKNKKLSIYLLHYDMSEEVFKDLNTEMERYSYSFHPINCREFFEKSDKITVNRYYTIEMYLWLFAPYLVPKEVDRALYLDPDIINLNKMESLYNQDFEENLFIAMDYEIKNKIIQPLNNLRLGTSSADHYFNTGVVLMNIEQLRTERNPEEITEAVIKNKAVLILPDQDIFNLLYTGEVKVGAWNKYNMDPRLYQVFQLLMPDDYNQEWLEEEVVFIHYAGKNKPWIDREDYRMDLGKYYFNYEEKLLQFEKKKERVN